MRERELLAVALPRLRAMPGVHVLADPHEDRIGVVSFVVEGVHHNLVTRLLHDHFGVHARGGCSCAGTYGHYLLHIDPTRSKAIFDRADAGDVTERPGWVRLSLHPTMPDAELAYVLDSIEETVREQPRWAKAYTFSPTSGEFTHARGDRLPDVRAWFTV